MFCLQLEVESLFCSFLLISPESESPNWCLINHCDGIWIAGTWIPINVADAAYFTFTFISLSLSCHYHFTFTFIPIALSLSIHLYSKFFPNYASSNNNLDCEHLNSNQRCRRSILCFHFHFNFTFISILLSLQISPLFHFYLHFSSTFISLSFLLFFSLLSWGNTLDHLGSLGLSLSSHTRVTSMKSCKTLGC